jgi:hypothetical protein
MCKKTAGSSWRLRHGAPAVFEAVGYDPGATPASRGASASNARDPEYQVEDIRLF